MTKLTALFLIYLATPIASLDPVPFSINTKKWSHVLDDHFISITVNPTDLLQGKVYGLAMNSTMAILKGLAPAYIRIGSADTAKYTFKRNRYPTDMVKPEDEYTVTETHWMVFNEVARSAGLDVIVCLNAAHRSEGTKKWDTRNSLELISFSDNQGYNLTWQLGYEVQGGEDLSGVQFGKDLNRLRTILNAFPRYQHAKLIGPDIRVIHKKEDIDFWNDVLIEAGPTLDAVTWHPRWPQPSKMKVSENSNLGYEFPNDYLESDRQQLNKILQRSIFKNPVWIGETKTESTGTFAEGLMWARRLVLAAKLGVEVVMKQPNLMDISHPKPEYWVALLHKRLLGKSVLETRSVTNATDLIVISHCTNPAYWSDKPEKLQDGPLTVYGVNMGGMEQKIQIKGTWTGRAQLLFQYVLTSGSDPDSVFSQMTYLNGEPLMMTDDGMLPELVPKIRKLERGLTMKLPPYSVGFWVIPEAKVKICQIQAHNIPTPNTESLPSANNLQSSSKNLPNIRDLNQFLVDKLTNPESEEKTDVKIEVVSSESTEKDINLLSKENSLPRVARRIRQVKSVDEINQELQTIMQETREILSKPDGLSTLNSQLKLPKATPTMEHRIQSFAEGISDAIKTTNQEREFDKFLEDAGLKKDFGSLLMNDRRYNAPGMRNFQPFYNAPNLMPVGGQTQGKGRYKKSISSSEEYSREVSEEDESFEEMTTPKPIKFGKKLTLARNEEEEASKNRKPDLVIPHQPDLKGLEERYKSILHSKIQDGKRKIDDIKRKVTQDESEITQRIKPPEGVDDIQEEIIKKEIELLEKTQETVADILKNQKKRQETFEDLIFDELNDVKEERITTLEEMYKNQRKKENSIVKRQLQTPLSRPLLKTVEYIEKNFNLEPESVRKIKRSLEEKMGEILRNYDVKKTLETQKRSFSPKEDKKVILRKTFKQGGRKGDDFMEAKNTNAGKTERNDEMRNSPLSLDRPKEKNLVQRGSSSPPKVIYYSKFSRSDDADSESSKDSMHKPSKTENAQRRREDEDDDSFEFFNEAKPLKTENVRKKPDRRRPSKEDSKQTMPRTEGRRPSKEDPEEMVRKTDRRRLSKEDPDERVRRTDRKRPLGEETEEKISRYGRKDSRNTYKEEHPKVTRTEKEDLDDVEINKKPRKFEEDKETSEMKRSDEVKENKVKPTFEKIPLKNDKDRRENMLKEITSMVNNMNSMERSSDRSKRKKEDEDISEEFESDLRSHKMKRRPRKAEVVEMSAEPEKETNEKRTEEKEEVVKKTEEPVTPTPTTTPASKLRKLKKTRVRPNRKLKSSKAKEEEESPQKKRHLANVDRPNEFEKKKLLKPKLRKLHPKLHRHENELPLNEKEKESAIPENLSQTVESPKEVSEPDMPAMQNSEKEFLKDLEELVEEKRFLDQDMEASKKDSKTNGDQNLEEKKDTEMDFSGETPTPTEGYIIVEPTIETETEEKAETEKPELSTTVSSIEGRTGSEEENYKEEKESENSEPEMSDLKEVENRTEEKTNDVQIPQSEILEQMVRKETSSELEEASDEQKDFFLSDNASSSEEASPESDERRGEKFIKPALTIEDVLEEESKAAPEVEMPRMVSNHRKRRATFLPNHGEDEEEDDDDYSSEERIQKFKQMVYKKSPAKKIIKNEVRPSSGIGADEFLRMAGSTMRVMFDDVIPEAYGQTKTKIQNMGISEYIKEFGNIVQQMKNLDQIFLNIGEAAVKGYIRGHRAEKGPYIQVISRKKRELNDKDLQEGENSTTDLPYSEMRMTKETSPITEMEETEATNSPNDGGINPLFGSVLTTDSPIAKITAPANIQLKPPEVEPNGGVVIGEESLEYARTSTGQKIPADKRFDNWSTIHPEQGFRESGRQESEKETQKTEKTSQSSQNVLKEIEPIKDEEFFKSSEENPGEKLLKDLELITNPVKTLHNKIPKISKWVQPKVRKHDRSDFHTMLRDGGVNTRLNPYLSEEYKDKLSPWIQTTRDFIQQALNTLQRQRQLSEILARETINDMMNKEVTRKVVGKREVENIEPELPVYHITPPNSNKKREANHKHSDESLVRRLRGLQPGVYVVPTEEMTNIRSEQITNEAKKKSGMPNVVTLNIYYDKKNPGTTTAKTEPAVQTSDPRLNQDIITYYQNKAWNTAASHYNQNNQFVSPVAVPDVNLAPPLVAPIPVAPANPIFTAEPRIAEIPNSRLIQYPSPTFHYPPVQKVYPSIVSRNPQQVYSPVYYVPAEPRIVPRPPGTKRQWNEFKARTHGAPSSANYNTDWNVQYETVPVAMRDSSKYPSSSYNKNFRMFADKKRSVAGANLDPTWSETALPFWKFFATSSSEKEDDKSESDESFEKEEKVSPKKESAESVLAENEKSVKEAEKKTEKEPKDNTIESVTEDTKAEESKSRRRRSLSDNIYERNELPTEGKIRKLAKRSNPYEIDFRDHDILPEWFGTYQEIGNFLEDLPPHTRRSHIISTPFSEEDEELLSILNADDELSLIDMDTDDDYYYASDNALGRLKRRARSTDQLDSAMLKTNMIYKNPMDNDHAKPKTLAKTGMKRLTDEDSSLETVTKSKAIETKPTNMPENKSETQQQTKVTPQTTQQPQLRQQNNQTQPQNGTMVPNGRNPNDDTFYYFFKYAYDSFVKVMKSMTELL